ncbi:class I SAM-dependent methyltransferase [Paracoccus sp. (in: a-proteobacteria)]
MQENHNIDSKTVDSFGSEWEKFAQDKISTAEIEDLFDKYFRIFPWHTLPKGAEGFDMGCGSGRWAKLVAPKVGTLNCIEPSPKAFEVTKRNLSGLDNVIFWNESSSSCGIPDGSQDFGYSLGVLHHTPNTAVAMAECVRLLREGAPFLVYLYYRFDNRPAWYRWLWAVSDLIRKGVSSLPESGKSILSDVFAAFIYYPLARAAHLADQRNINVGNWPLSSYKDCSFYTMRTDARDRFGTPLEWRFTKVEIERMMMDSGLENIVFSEAAPFWCACGTKKHAIT